MTKQTLKKIEAAAQALIEEGWSYCENTALSDNFTDTYYTASEICGKDDSEEVQEVKTAIERKTYELWQQKVEE